MVRKASTDKSIVTRSEDECPPCDEDDEEFKPAVNGPEDEEDDLKPTFDRHTQEWVFRHQLTGSKGTAEEPYTMRKAHQEK
ncbi:hypothetical protein AC579_7230 [Pseudocercospora musae]|uniref:Uncharacterized protein n=1 Tax=Pseudocercospora musae TaxID=113226 RepID=A0A139IF29_9PEZI|nr:hypothetical protein AC579_7230 [Pseudocercospora musae]